MSNTNFVDSYLRNTDAALAKIRFLLELYGRYDRRPGEPKSLVIGRLPFYYIMPGPYPRCAILESLYIKQYPVIKGQLLDVHGDLGMIVNPIKDLGILDICRLADMLGEHYDIDNNDQRA